MQEIVAGGALIAQPEVFLDNFVEAVVNLCPMNGGSQLFLVI